MRQLQLFTSAQLSIMRDRTRSRKYSPEREQFRREQARRRIWGLARRHAEKLSRIRAEDAELHAPKCAVGPSDSKPASPMPPHSGTVANDDTRCAAVPKRTATVNPPDTANSTATPSPSIERPNEPTVGRACSAITTRMDPRIPAVRAAKACKPWQAASSAPIGTQRAPRIVLASSNFRFHQHGQHRRLIASWAGSFPYSISATRPNFARQQSPFRRSVHPKASPSAGSQPRAPSRTHSANHTAGRTRHRTKP